MKRRVEDLPNLWGIIFHSVDTTSEKADRESLDLARDFGLWMSVIHQDNLLLSNTNLFKINESGAAGCKHKGENIERGVWCYS